MNFTELNLHKSLLQGVEDAGYIKAMPIQAAVFKHSFLGKDIYAQSHTGSGKTAAFLVTVLQRILVNAELGHKKALILTPTRELAVQIDDEASKLAKHTGISVGSFYGGIGYSNQIDMLKDNVQIIIGTPGRIIDLVKQGKMLLKDIGFLIIDEADRMFDMGFIDDLRLLIKYLPGIEQRQTLLFSATLNVRVKNLAWDFMTNPEEIVIESDQVTVETITQELYHVGSDEKMKILIGIMNRDKPENVIIFCNLKRTVEEIAKRLKINGFACEYIMGDLPQKMRIKIIEQFKEGSLKILIATDVAARGLDIEGLAQVINFDVPLEPENYIHRIGRTARAGKSGRAITLACEKYVYGLSAIEKYIEMKIPIMPIESELLAVDKSEGMHLHRDRKDGPNHNKNGHKKDFSRSKESNIRPKDTRQNQVTKEIPHQKRKEDKPVNSQKKVSGVQKSFSKNQNTKSISHQEPRKSIPKVQEHRHDKKIESKAKPQNEMYNLTMEDRMKLYRERYGKNMSDTKKQDPKQGLSVSKKNPHKHTPSQKGKETITAKLGPLSSSKPEKKKSIFDKIIGLFIK